jgi:hypothetical protein
MDHLSHMENKNEGLVLRTTPPETCSELPCHITFAGCSYVRTVHHEGQHFHQAQCDCEGEWLPIPTKPFHILASCQQTTKLHSIVLVNASVCLYELISTLLSDVLQHPRIATPDCSEHREFRDKHKRKTQKEYKKKNKQGPVTVKF